MNNKLIASIYLILLIVLTTACNPQNNKVEPTKENETSGQIDVDTNATLLETESVENVIPEETEPEATATATLTPEPTSTNTPSPTLPPSATPTPEPTDTPSPSPTPALNQPGFYNVGRCLRYDLKKANYAVTFCILNVVIKHNGNMVFTVNWTAHLPRNKWIGKQSDQGNKKMYLMDNLGNRYDHFAVGGDAATYVGMLDGDVATGWFEFPKAASGASFFTFHDDDQTENISGLQFSLPVIITEAEDLQHTPGKVEYIIEEWEPFETETGNLAWRHLEIAGCEVIEVPPGDVEGKYKNTIELGDLTYEIYGWTETEWAVREYLLVGGILEEFLEPSPLFHMLIPYDESLQCIFDGSNILGSYWIP